MKRKKRLVLLIAFLASYCIYADISWASPYVKAKQETMESSIGIINGDSLTKGTNTSNISQKSSGSTNDKTNQRKTDYKKQYDFIKSIINDSLQLESKIKATDTLIQTMQDSLDLLEKRLNTLMDERVTVEAYKKNVLWVRILLISLAFLLILNALYLILRFRGLRDEIVDVVTDSSRIKDWVKSSTEKPSIIPVPKSYDSEILSLQKENRGLKDKVKELENDILSLQKKPTAMAVEQRPTFSQHVGSQKLLYADSIIDGVFSHVWEKENDDTVFVLKQKNESSASITISDRAYKKVLANPSYLDGCDKQIVCCNSVVIMNEGEAEKGGNGKWIVITPLKVELR